MPVQTLLKLGKRFTRFLQANYIWIAIVGLVAAIAALICLSLLIMALLWESVEDGDDLDGEGWPRMKWEWEKDDGEE